MNNRIVYLVGKPLQNTAWEVVGVYATSAKAGKVAKDVAGIVKPVNSEEALPKTL